MTTFSNYKDFRSHLSAGSSVNTLLFDLGTAGYAGGDWGGWAANVAKIYEQNSGQSADAPLGMTTTVPVIGPLPVVGPLPNPTTTTMASSST